MAILVKSDSHTGLQDKLQKAIAAKHGNGSEYSYMGDTSIHDVWPGQVVHTIAGKRGKVFASKYKLDDKGAVTLGEPQEVQPAYKPVSEAYQAPAGNEINALQESTYDTTTGRLKLTVIQPGFNKSKSRYYPVSTLKRDHGIFKGAKMFMNHQTEAEAKARPEGNVQDWVANLIETSVTPNGTITGVAQVIDPAFKTKLETLQEAGLLHEMGVSIRAAGMQQMAEMEGVKTSYVESFKICKSVDFVTYPGAGGKAEMLEADTTDVDFITPEQLATRRPDLVKHFTEAAEEAAQQSMTEQEYNVQIAEANRQHEETKKQLKELQESTGKSTAAATLATKLAAATTLPEASKKRITAQFKEAVDDKGMQEAIDAEIAYIKDLGVAAAPIDGKGKGKIRGMGESDNGKGTNGDTDEKTRREAMIKSWKASGLSESDAIAATDRYFAS